MSKLLRNGQSLEIFHSLANFSEVRVVIAGRMSLLSSSPHASLMTLREEVMAMAMGYRPSLPAARQIMSGS